MITHMDFKELQRLYESQKGDIKIVLSEGQTKMVASNIISFVSPTLDKMLNIQMMESIIKTVDMSKYGPNNVDRFLRYVYYKDTSWFHDIESIAEDLCELYSMADYYQVSKLKTFLDKKIDVSKRDMRECDRAYHMTEMLSCFDKYGTLFDKFKNSYIDHITHGIRRSIALYYDCEDAHKDKQYSWCCIHASKPYADNYNAYRVDPSRVNSAFGCICTNLHKKHKDNKLLNEHDHEVPNGVSITVKYATHLCCLHSLYRDPNRSQIVYDSTVYNKAYLSELPANIRSEILERITITNIARDVDEQDEQCYEP